MASSILRLFFLFISLLLGSAWAGEYDFEIPEIEKKPYEFGGNLELGYDLSHLNKDSALYHQRFFNRNEGSSVNGYSLTAQLEGSYTKGITKLYAKGNMDMREDYSGWDEKTRLYEGFASVKPTPSLTLEAGKKVAKWGKGYAWSPVAFISRPKDPEDPEESVEGYAMATADFIKSLSGRIQTIAFTPVLFPVYDNINSEVGATGHINYAAKLYLLMFDTDIDVMFLAGKSIKDKIGLDFSRNIKTNLEIHGEIAAIDDYKKYFIDRDGALRETQSNAVSYLLGIRYLNRYDTTFILEFYRNGKGFSEKEIGDYFGFIEKGYDAYTTTGAMQTLKKAWDTPKPTMLKKTS